tara:strand:- start:554 stop:931 length:378 start_codon:yes stop_codon:yes gene_type:complete
METSTSNEQHCVYCEQRKPLSDFPPHSRYKLGVDNRCRDCINKNRKLIKKLKKDAPPEPERCECCGRVPKIDQKTGKPQSLRFDHDHLTEKFRGWICDRCNSGIGKLGDNVEGIVKALNYLIERK